MPSENSVTAHSESSTQRLQPCLFVASIAALVAALFHFFGVTDVGYDPATSTRSLFVWLSRRWTSYSATQDDFPYGWAAPLVSLWMIWRLRHELSSAAKRISYAGLALIILALLLHWLGARTQQTRITFAAFILLVWSVPFYLCGWRVARLLIIPACFLCFMIQLDFLTGFSLKFRQLQSDAAAFLLNGLGISIQRTANIIKAGEVEIMTTAGPGGLRSIWLLFAVTLLAAWIRPLGKFRTLVFLTVVPAAAFLSAVFRVSATAMSASAGLAIPPWLTTAGFYIAAFTLLYFIRSRLMRETNRGVTA